MELGYTDMKLLVDGVTSWQIRKKAMEPSSAMNKGSLLHYLLAKKDPSADLEEFYHANPTAKVVIGPRGGIGGPAAVKDDDIAFVRDMVHHFLSVQPMDDYEPESSYTCPSPCRLYTARARADALFIHDKPDGRKRVHIVDYKTSREPYMTHALSNHIIKAYDRCYDLQFAYYVRTIIEHFGLGSDCDVTCTIVWFSTTSGLVQWQDLSPDIMISGGQKLAKAEKAIGDYCDFHHIASFNAVSPPDRFMVMEAPTEAIKDGSINLDELDIDTTHIGF